jgi:hypothetical protein
MLEKSPYATACQYLKRIIDWVDMHTGHEKREERTEGGKETQQEELGHKAQVIDCLHVTYIAGLGGSIRVGP